MISRTLMTCLACKKPITARIQVGHEIQQPLNFSCPNCGTEVKLTLLLDNPPRVKIKWEENCASGKTEDAIINIGAGFSISKEKLHQDMYFPSFDAPQASMAQLFKIREMTGRRNFDAAIEAGTLPHAEENWKTIQRAMRFHRTGQNENMEAQLRLFWGEQKNQRRISTTDFSHSSCASWRQTVSHG